MGNCKDWAGYHWSFVNSKAVMTPHEALKVATILELNQAWVLTVDLRKPATGKLADLIVWIKPFRHIEHNTINTL
jgi:imidazolonepropionase-like amidohydrolase